MLEHVHCRTKKNYYTGLYCIGTKLFNSERMVRIIDSNRKVATVRDERTGEIYTEKVEKLKLEYNRLIPVGVFQMGIIKKNSKLPIDDFILEFNVDVESAYTNNDGFTIVYHPIEMMKEYNENQFTYNDAIKDETDREAIVNILLQSGMVQDFYNYDPYEIEDFIDTIPEKEINLTHYRMMAVYFDDHIDSLMGLISSWDLGYYNNALRQLGEYVYQQTNKKIDLIKEISNLKDVLDRIGIYFTIDCNFNIVNMDFQTKVIGETPDDDSEYNKAYMIDDKSLSQLIQVTLGLNISNIIIMKYWYDIDFDSIAGKYLLLRSVSDNKLFILTYSSNGINQESMSTAFDIYETNSVAHNIKLHRMYHSKNN